MTDKFLYDHLPPPRASTLLLSCMDYRLIKHVHDYMVARGLQDDYNHIVLAGGAVGVNSDQHQHWGDIFWEHLHISVTMHHISRVIVLDHRHCAGHRLMLGPEVEKDHATETASHRTQLLAIKTAIIKQHPHLTVELGLMDLDGKVEPMG